MGGNVDVVVGTIHRGRIVFWHIYFHLPDGITEYSIKWDIDFGYHLETKPIFCRGGTKLFTMAVKAQILIEVPMRLIELLAKCWTHLVRVLGTTIKVWDQGIFTFRAARFVLLGSFYCGAISVD